MKKPIYRDLFVKTLQELASRFFPCWPFRSLADRRTLDFLHDEKTGRGKVFVDCRRGEPIVLYKDLMHPLDVRRLFAKIEFAMQRLGEQFENRLHVNHFPKSWSPTNLLRERF